MTYYCEKCDNDPTVSPGCCECMTHKESGIYRPVLKTLRQNEEIKLWFDKKLNGLFCPVHGSGVAVCNCKTPPVEADKTDPAAPGNL